MKLRSLFRAIGIIAVSTLLVVPLAQSSAQGATKNTYKLIWSDEFNRKAGWAPDKTKWTYDTMLGPNSEKQYYTTSRLNSLHDGKGNMVITSRLITETSPYYNYCLPDLTDTCWYTSARLKTANLVGFKYGKITARIKMPAGQGVWPAFWMLGQDLNEGGTWPDCGEIDIVEAKESQSNLVFGTAHGPNYSGGQGIGNVFVNNQPLSAAYHTYSIIWKPNRIEWYFDGKLYHTLTPTDVMGNLWPYNQEFFLILNLAMGGTFAGDVDPSVKYAKMYVDYIRVYSVNGVGKVIKRG